MLIFEVLPHSVLPCDLESFTRALSAACKAAGYALRESRDDRSIPDGILVLSCADSASLPTRRGKGGCWVAAAQIRLDTATTGGERTASWTAGNADSFGYPFALELAPADISADLLCTWLAGFATFAACVKTWRALRERPELGQPRELRVSHINILARDLDRSIKFYRHILGAKYCYNLGPRKVVMELNGFDFFIEQTASVSYPRGYHFGLRTNPAGVEAVAKLVDSDGTIEIVKGNGPAPGFNPGPDRVRTAVYFLDPDGLEIEVYSPEVQMLETNHQLIGQHLVPPS